MTSYGLLSLEEIERLSQREVAGYYRDHINPGIAAFLRLLGWDRYKIDHAEGMYLHTECGRRILDFCGGLGVLGHGHNHPRILAARRRFSEGKRLEICKAFISNYQSGLARNLSKLFPGDLQYSFFCNSGAEANEGALKLALLCQGPAKDKILHTDLGYHGKTFGAMSVSGSSSSSYRELFKKLDGCIEVAYGDIESVRQAIKRRTRSNRNDIAAMIIEAVKADLVLNPPEGYLPQLEALCVENDIILIVDEVFTGFGRTGRMFAFEHSGIVPDIVTFSKALGGGKASIAGYITKPHIFRKTYAPLSRCTVHSTTYGGLGEECATAIEAINVIVEEGLVENARRQGEHLLAELRRLQHRHPRYIKEARGCGLLCLLEFRKTSEVFGGRFLGRPHWMRELCLGLLPGLISSELFDKHDILIYAGGREDNLIINPALIVKREEIDTAIMALDQVLSHNLLGAGLKMAKNFVFG